MVRGGCGAQRDPEQGGVGGSEAFLQSTPTVHGSSLENGYFIDGMDVSALDGNGTVAAMYLDPYAYQETNIQTGGGGSAR